ncbi:PIN domain-containing protein [Inquilinus sp.]|uniref:PIN domain-containing protein n=1 Tax=Inquilinus sp. TaxID=1932117 RepID=UPI0031CE953C
MISTFTAFFDANVFYGARLRSLTLWLAQTGVFRARWSEEVHDEWTAAVSRRLGIPLERLQRTRSFMNDAVEDSVVQGYQQLIPVINLPDPKDRHVVAAAIIARASVIVTSNLRDFPEETLSQYGIHTRTPDDFIMDVASIHKSAFAWAVRKDFINCKKPKLTPDGYANELAAGGVTGVAEMVRKIGILLEIEEEESAEAVPASRATEGSNEGA